MKSLFQENNIELYSTQNKGISLLLKDLLEPKKLKSTDIRPYNQNVYIDKLDDIVNKYKNTYHSTIKMKCLYVTSSTYIELNERNNKEDPKFEVPNWSEKVFLLKVKNTVSWTCC